MQKNSLAGAIAATLIGAATAGTAIADKGGFGFKPIDASAASPAWNPAAPWKLPKGFIQTVVSNENDLSIYAGGRNDSPDMNTVNQTGPQAAPYPSST